MKKVIAVALVFLTVLLFVFFYRREENEFIIEEGTAKSCLEGALRARQGFKGTEFEHWNFYESCVLNIECANPMHLCPVEEIHDQSRFFLDIDP